jgi:anion-transporting  ArsA/GET3 family ATPase
MSEAPSSKVLHGPMYDRRFVLVTGKGGVGKSTVSALLAAHAAARGRRTLVCELNAVERIPALFGRSPVGPTVTALRENLWGVNIQPAQALEEYAQMKLRVRAVARLVFDNPFVQRFMQLVPGMNDLLLLGKAFNHEREVDASGRPVWDTIVVDAPATGHGVTFFRLPRVIRDHVPVGNMHDEARDMWNLLTDPARTATHLVTLPEELPVQETRELAHTLFSKDMGLPPGALWLNQVPPPLFDADSRARIGAGPPAGASKALDAAFEVARIRLGREAQAQAYLTPLKALGLPLVTLPLLYTRDLGPAELETLLARAGDGGTA